MSGAIWTLHYDIAPEDRARYLEWFHGTHIPDKLARPGYSWAGHYQPIGGDRYIALFGGDNTRVFFDPSPAQLKKTQNPLTREMIGLRQNPTGFVFTEEWDCEGPEIAARPGMALELLCTDATDDDAFNVWLAQEAMPAFAEAPGAVRARKLLSTMGPAKHGVLLQFTSKDALTTFRSACPDAALELTASAGTPLSAERLWPEPE